MMTLLNKKINFMHNIKMKSSKRYNFRTVVLSDIHLGTTYSKVNEVNNFLKLINCNYLILNGDIIDGWHIKKNGTKRWQKKHTNFFKSLTELIEHNDTKIIYVQGNHDDFLESLAPIYMGNIQIVKDYVLDTKCGRYFITHGDIFDHVTCNMKWLAYLGDAGYTFLLWFNDLYNNLRTMAGKPYYSLSKRIKQKVKKAVSYISKFESTLSDFAHSNSYDGIICGHIHHPANTYYGKIHYLNSGDWVETLSALVEDYEGNWQIIYYSDILQDTNSIDNKL